MSDELTTWERIDLEKLAQQLGHLGRKSAEAEFLLYARQNKWTEAKHLAVRHWFVGTWKSIREQIDPERSNRARQVSSARGLRREIGRQGRNADHD
jgi:hypothetical protein